MGVAGVEGLVVKDAGSRYPTSARQRVWHKLKTRRSVDLLAVGVFGDPADPVALQLAVRAADGSLAPVGTTSRLTRAAARDVGRLLRPTGQTRTSWGGLPGSGQSPSQVAVIEPLVVEVDVDEAIDLRPGGEILRHSALDELARQAVTDPLTGLGNRRRWDTELAREASRAARTGAPLSVVLLDLDHFKAYNDSRGHPAGDRLLREAARAWQRLLRADDVLSRIGGEEFAVLLPDCPVENAARLAAGLLRAVPDNQTCSAGVTRYAGDLPETLLARADAALYRAKTSGRNRVEQTAAPAGPAARGALRALPEAVPISAPAELARDPLGVQAVAGRPDPLEARNRAEQEHRMPQDPHDLTGSIPSTSVPGTAPSNGTAPTTLPARRFIPAQLSREGTALGAAIALLMFGSAAQLAGGLAEGGPLLTAGLACLGIHSSSSSSSQSQS